MPQPIAPLVADLLQSTDTMYPLETTLGGVVKHSRLCKSTFGRRDWNCHRCVELMLGSAPRDGWQHEYFARKLRQAQRSFSWE